MAFLGTLGALAPAATLAGGVAREEGVLAAGGEPATCFLAGALACKNNIDKVTVEKRMGRTAPVLVEDDVFLAGMMDTTQKLKIRDTTICKQR